MHLAAIIAEIADQADEFLKGVTDRAQARAGIAEQINLDFFERAERGLLEVEGGAGCQAAANMLTRQLSG